MGNLINYVKVRGSKDFAMKAFTTEDALVLAEFCYLKFDNVLEEMSEKPMGLEDIMNHPEYESLFSDHRYEKDNRGLFEAMVQSERFKNLKICMFINHIDLKDETQFCAMTFLLPEGNTYIAFRGTDETIVGWQEDFRLALDEPVPGQKLSAKYVNDVSQRLSGSFIIGGHSKGGNLAMYSAMNCSDAVQERIKTIYSFDGPGFRQDVLDKYGFDKIKSKIVSIIPKSSYVGLLLATDENSIVVDSKSISVWQHNPYTWVINKCKLVESHLSEQHLLLLDTFNEWLCGLDEEHLNVFVTMLVEILNATEAENTRELSAGFYKHAMKVVKASKELDEETREFLMDLLKSFAGLMKDKVINEMTVKAEDTKEEVSLKLALTKEEVSRLIEETREKFEKIKKKKTKQD